jgi:hypothetical protein
MAQDCNCTKQDDTIGVYVLHTLRVAARAQATLESLKGAVLLAYTGKQKALFIVLCFVLDRREEDFVV